MTPEQFLERCRGVGIALFANGDAIRYRTSSPGLATPRFLETLKKHKPALLPILPRMPVLAPVRHADTPDGVPGVPGGLEALGAAIDDELEKLQFRILLEAKRDAYAGVMPVLTEPIVLDSGARIANPAFTYRRMFEQWQGSDAALDVETSLSRRIWAQERQAQAEGVLDAISYWWWLYRKDECAGNKTPFCPA